jgi:hypothetical protein
VLSEIKRSPRNGFARLQTLIQVFREKRRESKSKRKRERGGVGKSTDLIL